MNRGEKPVKFDSRLYQAVCFDVRKKLGRFIWDLFIIDCHKVQSRRVSCS